MTTGVFESSAEVEAVIGEALGSSGVDWPERPGRINRGLLIRDKDCTFAW